MLKLCTWCCCGNGRNKQRDGRPHRLNNASTHHEQNDKSITATLEGGDSANANTVGANTSNEIVLNNNANTVPGVVVNLHNVNPHLAHRLNSVHVPSDESMQTLFGTLQKLAELQQTQLLQTERLISRIDTIALSRTPRSHTAHPHRHSLGSPDATDSLYNRNTDTLLGTMRLSPLQSPVTPIRYNNNNSLGRPYINSAPGSLVAKSAQPTKLN